MSATSALVSRFDRWTDSGPFTPRDLATYRIIFALLMLLRVPRFRIVDAFPDSFYAPPPGPMWIFPGLPPDGVMVGVELLLSIAFAALALGYRTTVVSWAATVLMLYGYGASYSLGKIDHTIFLVILPAVLSFARWGDALSVDAVLARRRGGRSQVSPSLTTPQWPMRLLAVLIGLGFLTAAVPKVLAGWLDPRSQAVQNLISFEYYVHGRTEYLAPVALNMDVAVLWELGDVFTVLLEAAFIVAALNWRAFRSVMAVATVFHLGVLLTMNIFFVANVIVYGAFVSWSALGGSRPRRHAGGGALRRLVETVDPRRLQVGAVVLAVVGGVGVRVLRQTVTLPSTSWPILVVGALVGVWYLSRQVVALIRLRRRPREIDLTPDRAQSPVRSSDGHRSIR